MKGRMAQYSSFAKFSGQKRGTGWMDVRAHSRIAYSNKNAVERLGEELVNLILF
jgi:hypothetical protein